jgi:hypothetical protein
MASNKLPSSQELQALQVDEDKITELLAWLRTEFEKIDATTIQMKTNRIIEAARRLDDLKYPKEKIASALALWCEMHELASRAWVYKVLPLEYKNQKRSEDTRRGMASAAQPLQLDVPCLNFTPWTDYTAKEGEHIKKIMLKDHDFQKALRRFNELLWSAKTGPCGECNCLNCRSLRGMPLL